MTDEIPLTGGNLTPAVRVGDTVRRTMGPWSPAVHHLLAHLERVGFTGAPRFLGIDERSREILSFLPGEVGFIPQMWTDAALVGAATLLRRFHAATVGYRPPDDARWQLVYPNPTQYEVICHNDAAPYNLVFTDGVPTALIDFDFAGPGPRLWDVAYTLYWFAPLYAAPDTDAPGLADLPHTAHRIRTFCTIYGIPANYTLLVMVERRLAAVCTRIIERAAAGDPAYQHMIATGHLDNYQRSLATWHTHQPILAALLGA